MSCTNPRNEKRQTNKSKRLEVGSRIWNDDVRVCPFMMLGMYLFQLYHVENQPFPDFMTSRHWYFTKLLQSDPRDPTKQWSYSSHYSAMEKAMKARNMYSTKKAHMAHGAGARMCDFGGVSDSNIRRLGRWNSDSMSNAYVIGLPKEAMRKMGEFTSKEGRFSLTRAIINPPEELQRKVFPETDVW